MTEGKTLQTKQGAETSKEKQMREWFDKQHLESITTFENAARQVTQLVTLLFGTTFGILTLGNASFNNVLASEDAKWLGAVIVGVWIIALVSALIVTTPFTYSVNRNKPESEESVFGKILLFKKVVFYISFIAFGAGTTLFAIFIIYLIMTRQVPPPPSP